MNILARLLSHGFAIAVVVLLAIGLIYRGELFPDLQWPAFMTPGTGTNTADSTESRQSGPETLPAQKTESAQTDTKEPTVTGLQSTTGKTGTGEPAEEATTATASEIPPEMINPAEKAPAGETSADMAPPVVESTGLAEVVEPPVREELSTGMQAIPSTETEIAATGQTAITPGVATEIPKPGVSLPADTDRVATAEPPTVTSPGERLPPAVEETATTGTGSSATPEALEGKRPYELLAAAREAYWLHDYDLAEANYRKWMELEPDNPDSYGELGNLFFSQGKWEEAASAYYEAGVRLVNSGHLQQASELLEVIRGLNGSQSEDLERLIKQANQ